MPKNLGDTFEVEGRPQNQGVAKLWRANRLASPPSQETRLPSGNPDYGPITTGTNWGHVGAMLFQNVEPGEYYLSVEYQGHIVWKPVSRAPDVDTFSRLVVPSGGILWPDGTVQTSAGGEGAVVPGELSDAAKLALMYQYALELGYVVTDPNAPDPIPEPPPDPPPADPSLQVYADALTAGWTNGSWGGTVTVSATDLADVGTASFRHVLTTAGAGAAGILLQHAGVDVDAYAALAFSIRTDAANHLFNVILADTVGNLTTVSLNNHGGPPAVNTWLRVTIPLTALGHVGNNITSITIRHQSGGIVGTTWRIDNVRFTGTAPTAAESVRLTPAQFAIRGILSDADALARITPAAENRSGNVTANAVFPTDQQLTTFYTLDIQAAIEAGNSAVNVEMRRSGMQRVTGRPGRALTTDEIFQWGSYKWGLPEDVIRAVARHESFWRQTATGDYTTNQSLWPPDNRVVDPTNSAKYAQSYGIMQMKWVFHGKNVWPLSRYSTAFNVDYYCNWLRFVYDGGMNYLTGKVPLAPYVGYRLGSDDEQFWGAIGSWKSGGWYDQSAIDYIAIVKAYLADEPWLDVGWPE